MNEELMKEIKGIIPWMLVAAIAVGGWYGWKGYSAAKAAAASEAVSNAYTVEEIEEAADKYSGEPVEGALKLRLAKKYFDANRFQEAYDIYVALEKNPPEGFADNVTVGKAHCLEAQGKFAEALAAFDGFAKANPDSALALTAKLGAARCVAQGGDKAAALERLEALKEEVKDDELAKLRVEQVEGFVKR